MLRVPQTNRHLVFLESFAVHVDRVAMVIVSPQYKTANDAHCNNCNSQEEELRVRMQTQIELHHGSGLDVLVFSPNDNSVRARLRIASF